MRRISTATRLVVSLLVALVLSFGVLPAGTAAALTWYPKICTGFTGCSSSGYGNAAYSGVYTTSHWGQYRGHNCTNYVAYRMIQNGITQFITPGSGNATTWGAQARKKGVQVDKLNPEVGDVAWWDNTLMGSSGHVAYVESVNRSAGTFVVSQDSWGGDFSWRTYRISEVSGFIHVGNKTPFGELNDLKAGTGQVTVRGWTIDMDKPTSALKVRVYIGGPVGTGERHDLVANLKRSEIGAIYTGTGKNHGFKATLTTELKGRQKVYVYAVNSPSGTNPLIGSGSVTIADPDPVGSVDTLETLPSQVRVAGWAADPNAPTSSLQVQVYVGGKQGSSTAEVATTTTGSKSTAAAKALSGAGTNSGYDTTFVTSKRGRQGVYVYAANTGPGADALIGKGTVTIPDPLEFTASVAISGTVRVGKTLTAKPSFSPAVDLTYQWYRDGKKISGATAATYTLTPTDVGAVIKVKARGAMVGYVTKTVTSPGTSKVALGTYTIRSNPRFTGTTKVGKKLTVHTGRWQDNGRTLGVTWYRDGVRFKAGTSKTYTLTSKDKGTRITAKVSYKRTGYKTVFKSTAATAKIAS